MRDLLILTTHLIVTVAQRLRLGSVCALAVLCRDKEIINQIEGVARLTGVLMQRNRFFPGAMSILMTAFDRIAEYAQDGFSMNGELAELVPKAKTHSAPQHGLSI